MKAAMFYGKEDIRVEDVPEVQAGRKQIKIKVKWCGICGTDLHEYTGGERQTQHGGVHPLTNQQMPLALGHEFSGEIVEIGEGCVGDFKVGDAVTADPCWYCGTCESCRFGRYNSCESLGFVGLASMGAFAEYVVIQDYQCNKLVDGMTFEQGAVVEPAAVVLHSVRKAGISLGETVVVVGLGPIGLLAVQATFAAGAARVYGVDSSPSRLEGALNNGCAAVFDFTKCDPAKEIKKANGGKGVHVAIDCVGNNATMQTCLNATRPMATIILPGQESKFTVDVFPQLNYPEKNILSSHVYHYEFERTIPLVADGRIKMETIVTAKIHLDDIVEKGFKELQYNSAKHIKILVTPDKSLL